MSADSTAPMPSALDSLSKSFQPTDIERKWYPVWERAGNFVPNGDASKAAYTIQLPPPNVTGTLHMGHAFQQTLMDSLIRYHRMKGDNTNWVVGTDHAGIATQIVVERQLQAEGKSRHDLGREEFSKRVWQWKEQSGSTITEQMRRLGASANWNFADATGAGQGYFTMDDHMSKGVVETFVTLYEQGLIYRGKRLVNWDPVLQSAVSELEVESVERDGFMWHILYPFSDGPKPDHEGNLIAGMHIATTRPETMLADGALAVHPEDERYKHLVGTLVDLPLCGRKIPIIADDFVDRAFGSGCVKITGAHDFNDYACALRHNIPLITIFTLDAKINENGPRQYWGLDRFDCRKAVLEDLEAQNFLQKAVPHKSMVPMCERTGQIIEPMLTDQWFVAMSKATDKHAGGLAGRALDAVKNGDVKFYPEHWTATYNHWLGNIRDWCISRQLWWGHQIPAWYDEQGNVYVGRSEEEVRANNPSLVTRHASLTRDPDVLDTWFSSALVCHTTLGWPDLARFAKDSVYLPSNVLVTGNDIIFFWVARMVMMTLHFTDKVPFRDVYINAMVRDAEGTKMSKSKGNVLDPIDLLDGIELEALVEKSLKGLMLASHKEKAEKYIRKNFATGIPAYGADAVRFTYASLCTMSMTLNFDLSRCEGYRNFCNKLWNATRFVLMNVEGKDCGIVLLPPPGGEGGGEGGGNTHPAALSMSLSPNPSPSGGGEMNLSFVDKWLLGRLQIAKRDIAEGFDTYRFDFAAKALYEFVWDEYCDWYVECAKVQLAEAEKSGDAAAARGTRSVLVRELEATLRLAHPIMPFISEELWQKVAPIAGKSGATISTQPFPKYGADRVNARANDKMALLKQIVTSCRILRSEMKLSPAERVPLVMTGDLETLKAFTPYIAALGKLSDVRIVDTLPANDAPVQMVGDFKLMLEVKVDPVQERARLDKEIARLRGEVVKAEAKLNNPAFADKAPPAVVAQERARLASFAATLAKVTTQRTSLG